MKKGLMIAGGILLVIIVAFISFYIWGMGAKNKNTEEVTFIIEPGTSKTTIAKNLETSGLIKSQYALDIYLFFSGNNIQAGEYLLSSSMSPKEMIAKFSKGDIKINSISITLVEGKRLVDYAKTLSEKLSFTENEFINKANDQEFLKELVDSKNYWFLTNDILNTELYYPLEGYLYPDTYEFLENTTPENVIKTLLAHTEVKLENYKNAILESPYSFHQLLTMASIVQKEANTIDDRKMAAQVFFTRMKDNWSLGSDVTAYYGVKKEMGEAITVSELNSSNPYNTRLTDGSMNGKLPIGPICNPDVTSVEASLNPSDTNYYYFVANVCTGEVFFQNTSEEFYAKVRELQAACSAN